MSASVAMKKFLQSRDVNTVAVVDLQFGDTGKGKIVDLIASDVG
jgi:hypothetical protein